MADDENKNLSRLTKLEKKVDGYKTEAMILYEQWCDKLTKYSEEISELKELSERNRLRVDELKEFRHDIAMPRIIGIEEVLRELMDIFKRVCHNLKIGKPLEDDWDEMWDGFKTQISFLEEKLDADKAGSARQTVDYKKKYEDCMKSKVSVSRTPKHWVDDAFQELNEGEKIYTEMTPEEKMKEVQKIPTPSKFTCGNCGKLFEAYHDGDGLQTGLCQKCYWLDYTGQLEKEPPEPYAYRVLYKEGYFEDFLQEDHILVEKADLENMIFILKQKRQTTFAEGMEEKYLKGDKKE